MRQHPNSNSAKKMLLPLFLCHASFTLSNSASHAATSCYSDTECGPLSWCEIVGEPSSGGMYNCTSKPPPSGCKTYSVLDPGEQGECRYACYANPGGGPGPAICTSTSCAFYNSMGVGAPFNVTDLLYLAENCVSGGDVSHPTTGQCSIC